MTDVSIVLAAVLLLMKPLGGYMAAVLEGRRTLLSPLLRPAEKAIYGMCGISPKEDMTWVAYGLSVLSFSLFGFALLFLVLLLQGVLPLNPAGMGGVEPALAFNIAISFVTNTNWQSYSGEQTLSAFSELFGLTVQNFLSAAVGIAVAAALFRAICRKQTAGIGNFWVDTVRATLYVLLPLSLLFSAVYAAEGVVQRFSAPVETVELDGMKQTIAVAPAASRLSIKQLGSNGGGIFNANSSHPLENPTPLTNLLQMISILLLPVALLYTFGLMAGDKRQGWALLAAVMLLFGAAVIAACYFESLPNPTLGGLQLNQSQGNTEGKETRFGVTGSAFWSAATTATSNGSANAAYSSFTPLASLVPFMLMQSGEVVIGGAGSGVYSLLLFVIITVFLGGLMVGRTPEYMGKKLGPYEIKMASLAIILPSALTLIGMAVAYSTEAGRAGLMHQGPHGFSEIMYAMTSAANNNGSAFAGLSANTPFYNLLLGVLMFFGRFFVIIPVLAIAGSIAAKNHVPESAGTMATHTPLFVIMLASVIFLFGLLTFIPSLALGPVVEHLLATAG